jgi:hypothetical protein
MDRTDYILLVAAVFLGLVLLAVRVTRPFWERATRKLILRAAIRAGASVMLGTYLALEGRRIGGIALIAFGLVDLAIAWRASRFQVDPAVDEALQRAMKLEKTDPAAAERILDEAFAQQAEREGRELAQLRDRAPFDHAAAKELERRLRRKLELNVGGRRDFEKQLAGQPGLPAMLQSLDEEANTLRHQLAEVEQHLQRLPSQERRLPN